MKAYVASIIFCLFAAMSSEEANAGDIDACPSMPAMRREESNAKIYAGASLIKRLVGNFEVNAEYNSVIDDIFGQDNGVERAKYVYLVSQCIMIMRSYSDPSRQREEFRQEWERMFGITTNQHSKTNNTESRDKVKTLEIPISHMDYKNNQRLQWEKKYFKRSNPDGDWSVVVNSPLGEDRGWEELYKFKSNYQNIQFRLRQPYNSTNPHWAVVAGDGLSKSDAITLASYIRSIGVAKDAYIRKPDGY